MRGQIYASEGVRGKIYASEGVRGYIMLGGFSSIFESNWLNAT